MYKNLKAEIARAGMTSGDIAESIGKSVPTVFRLLSGKQPFRLGEMMALQSELEERNGAAYTLDYLFEDGDENGEGKTDEGAHASSVRPD
jgi:hypothetical protein|nr:MAG TPA: SOS-response transcriptional repressor [Caudoviricetes sp.]